MKISLNINKGFKWLSKDSIYIKGYFFDKKSNFYENDDAINFLKRIKNREDFLNFITEINGVFSIITTINNTTYLASDISRSFPLFYTFNNNQLYISDTVLSLKNKFNLSNFNPLSQLEIKASNHTHGKKTLLNSVFQLQANEFLIIKDDTILENDFIFSYAINKENSSSYNSIKDEVKIAFENSFKRLINSLNNRMVVIPLSGGFDSRLIAVFLKKINYKNVVCYTYGNKNSSEIKNSKRVAKKLGFKWFFIEYSKELTDDYAKSNEFKEFAHFAGKFSSTPNLQEYFAIKYLKENKYINKDSVFIPGYAGDLLGGSQFLKVIPRKLKTVQIVDLIIKTKFSNYNLTSKETELIKKEIDKNLKNLDKNYQNKIPSSVFEDYDIKEKIAKYIFNSASFYNFFGYEHRIPFWDKELLTTFKKIPQKYKFNKLLFNDVLIENYFKEFDVNFKTELQPNASRIILQKLKNNLKPFFPTFIKQKVLKKNDWNNYQPITNQLLLEMKQHNLKVSKKSNDYNEIIAQWYVYLCKNEIL